MASALKQFGGILMIMGTSIGGGILALPIATLQAGFLPALAYLVFCWLLMTSGAFLILEVNLQLPENTNMISMARHAGGRFQAMLAWLTYLGLVYCLVAAYIAGASDVTVATLTRLKWHAVPSTVTIALTSIIALLIYRGVSTVDWINRFIMGAKLLLLVLIILAGLPYLQHTLFVEHHLSAIFPVSTVIVTAFGFGIIVPSLRNYFNSDVKTLRRILFLGSLIPLFIYIGWEAVMLNLMVDPHSKMQLINAHNKLGTLITLINEQHPSPWFRVSLSIFTGICIFTSFINVSLCLFDFFADAIGFKKRGFQGLALLGISFLPPLLSVLFFPHVFIAGLSIAGIFCASLMMLLPAIWAWKLRKRHKQPQGYRWLGSSILLGLVIILATLLVGMAIWFDLWNGQ